MVEERRRCDVDMGIRGVRRDEILTVVVRAFWFHFFICDYLVGVECGLLIVVEWVGRIFFAYGVWVLRYNDGSNLS